MFEPSCDTTCDSLCEAKYGSELSVPNRNVQQQQQQQATPKSPSTAAVRHQAKAINGQGGTLLPVLIVPGFMSSGLEIQASCISRSWVGKRVWLNLVSLGFGSLHNGGKLRENEKRRRVNYEAVANQNGETATANYSESIHREYVKEVKCLSTWMEHMTLSQDMRTERRGNAIRPIQGLAGVDYLTPGAFTHHLSYVFGPVISALKSVGYVEGQNLDAVPYDWRLPPIELEERDQFFTSMMKKIEGMRKMNNNTPVVLLCHSMGCKVAHYFLNFAKRHHKGGQKWLNSNIHTYMPIGAPHLGAPKSVRAYVSGDKMGLDTFLSDEEGLTLARSMGSGIWLVPTDLPDGYSAPPVAVVRRQGTLKVTLIKPVDCQPLIRGRDLENRPLHYQLGVSFGGVTRSTTFRALQKESRSSFSDLFERESVVTFDEEFVFATSTELPFVEDALQVFLREPGLIKKAEKERDAVRWLSSPIPILKALICCPFKYILCCPCTLVWYLLCCVAGASMTTADLAATAAGSSTVLASSGKIYLSPILTGAASDEVDVQITLLHTSETCRKPQMLRKPRETEMTLKIKWIAQPCYLTESDVEKRKGRWRPRNDTLRQTALLSRESLPINHNKTNQYKYDSVTVEGLLASEGLANIVALRRKDYETDKCGPLDLSSSQSPPVKRVTAVYGVNLPTEVGAVYKQQKTTLLCKNRVQNMYKLDGSARILCSGNETNHLVDKGVIMETRDTKQKLPSMVSTNGNLGKHDIAREDTVILRSGDGSVPYWSLQHCRMWRNDCDVIIHELDGAEHRAILMDERFHRILIKYVVLGTEGRDEENLLPVVVD